MPYSAQSFTKKLIFFHEQQLNIEAKKTVVWKVRSMSFEHATELAVDSTQPDFLFKAEAIEQPLNVEHIMEGKVKKLRSLKEFYKNLDTSNTNKQCSARKSRMIERSDKRYHT